MVTECRLLRRKFGVHAGTGRSPKVHARRLHFANAWVIGLHQRSGIHEFSSTSFQNPSGPNRLVRHTNIPAKKPAIRWLAHCPGASTLLFSSFVDILALLGEKPLTNLASGLAQRRKSHTLHASVNPEDR